MNRRNIDRKRTVTLALLTLLAATGCSKPAAPSPSPPPSPPVSATALAKSLATPVGETLTLFRQRPGEIVCRISGPTALLGTLSVNDLGSGPSPQKQMFSGTTRRLRGLPAVSTHMGDGIALLAAGRFLVEADAVSPAVSDAQRDRWLSSVDLARLSALADPSARHRNGRTAALRRQ